MSSDGLWRVEFRVRFILGVVLLSDAGIIGEEMDRGGNAVVYPICKLRIFDLCNCYGHEGLQGNFDRAVADVEAPALGLQTYPPECNVADGGGQVGGQMKQFAVSHV